jgi:DNA-binding response OmpR family regulator
LNPAKPKSSAAQPASILVVDDTPANLQVLAGMLKDRGYKVRPVPSGKLALLAARRDPPDLILLDINMPEMNGYEVCEHLKADDQLKGIPVIFISALTEQLDKVKAFAIGGVDYLTKPFQMEELHARVETHLKLRRLQIEMEEYSRHLELARERLKLDLELAREVQRGFLPLRLLEVPGYEFFAHYESAPTQATERDLAASITRMRKQFLENFDAAYVENVILPHFLVSTYKGERPSLPMIDVTLTKQNALPFDLWGMLSESWKPSPEQGVTVFLQALEKRGPDNRRKRIYMSAVTPDLYRPMYSNKVAQFPLEMKIEMCITA